MVRNVIGSALALLGATAAVWSPFRAWYDGRHGRYFRLDELFSGGGITDARAELFGSLFLPFAFAALVTLVGVVLRSRVVVAVAGVIVLGFTVLWMVREGQAEGSIAVAGDGSGLGQGVANAFGGGVVILVAAVVMRGRSRGWRPAATAPPEPGAPDWTGPDSNGPAPTATMPTLDDPERPAWQRPPTA
ncbi:hypothetical protein ACQB60_12175 [Actinomycetota bacterium Odt1-20B]